MQKLATFKRILATALVLFGAISFAPVSPVHQALAKNVPGCTTQPGCQIHVINPGEEWEFGCLVEVTNNTHLPIIVVLRPDGFLEFFPTNKNQKSAKVTIEVVSPTDVLVRINNDGSFTVIHDTKITVALDGKPHYAILSKLQLSYTGTSKGKSVTVGEGTFDVTKGATVSVAAGGAISISPKPTKPIHVKPAKGFVLQLKINGKWVTVTNNTIPVGAQARFALATPKKCKIHMQLAL
ncbi:MAG: hypothetical protein JWO42_2545 [Chloroflexi bacterium]|nr:hypothetical protein [Chloroflexota bacterium]